MNACISDPAPSETPAPKQRKRKERVDCVVPTQVLYDSLVAHFGIVAYVAIAVGISRVAVYKRIDRIPELKLARDGARRMVVSAARYHLKKALQAGIDWAVQFAICRMDGMPLFSLKEPQEPKEPAEPREPEEPREPLEDEPERSGEVEPQPEVADRKTLRLIRAVERGEPWAVKYCLSHLEPGGPYEKKPRGRMSDRSPAGGLPPVQPQPVWPPAPVDEDAAEVARIRYYEMSGRPFPTYDRRPAAVGNDPVTSSPAPTIAAGAELQEYAPTVSVDGAEVPAKPAPTLCDSTTPAVPREPAPTISEAVSPSVDDTCRMGFPARPAEQESTHAPDGVGRPSDDETAPTVTDEASINSAPTKSAKGPPSGKGDRSKDQSRDRTRKRRVRAASGKKKAGRRVPSPIG